ncbi:hypothetical protein HDV00_002929 [Rhizophlyctis rosea]|nr:hypothetical protein HDV00_002929 [Rhizophlyctis rosea]
MEPSVANGVHALSIIMIITLLISVTSASVSMLHQKSRRFPIILYVHLAVTTITLLITIASAVAAFRSSVQAVRSAEDAWRNVWSDAARANYQLAQKCCGYTGFADAGLKAGSCSSGSSLPGCGSSLIAIFRGVADEATSSLFISIIADFICILAAVVALGVYNAHVKPATPPRTIVHPGKGAQFHDDTIRKASQYPEDSEMGRTISYLNTRQSVQYQQTANHISSPTQPQSPVGDILYNPPQPPRHPPPRHLTVNTSYAPREQQPISTQQPVPPPRVATAGTRGLWSGPNLQVKIPSPTLSDMPGDKDAKSWSKPWSSPTV